MIVPNRGYLSLETKSVNDETRRVICLYRQGRTIGGHTWVRRVALLVFGQLHGSITAEHPSKSVKGHKHWQQNHMTGGIEPQKPVNEKTHLINTLQIRTQPPMNTKHTTIHYSSQRQIIKYFTTPSPHMAAPILSLTFIIKPIHLCYLSGFMVPSYQRYSFRITNFES